MRPASIFSIIQLSNSRKCRYCTGSPNVIRCKKTQKEEAYENSKRRNHFILSEAAYRRADVSAAFLDHTDPECEHLWRRLCHHRYDAEKAGASVGVNIAIVTGYRLQRLKGALICAVGAVIPPIVIISILSLFYSQFRDNRYIAIMLQVMRAGVAAVIADVVIGLAEKIIKTKCILWIGMMAAAFAATCFFRVSAATIILICGAIGLLHALTPSGKEGRV